MSWARHLEGGPPGGTVGHGRLAEAEPGVVLRLVRAVSALGYLGLLWLLASVAVVSVGPATFALHRAVIRWHRDHDRTPTWRDVVADLRGGLRSGLVLSLLLLAGTTVVALDLLVVVHRGSPLLTGMLLALGLVWLLLAAPTWVLLASGESASAPAAFADSARLLTRRPGRSMGAAAAWMVPWALLLLLPPSAGVVATLLVPPVTAWLSVLALTWAPRPRPEGLTALAGWGIPITSDQK